MFASKQMYLADRLHKTFYDKGQRFVETDRRPIEW